MESVLGLENGHGQCSRCHASLPKLPVTPASFTGPGLPWPWVSRAQDSEKRGWTDCHPAAGVRGERLGLGSQG